MARLGPSNHMLCAAAIKADEIAPASFTRSGSTTPESYASPT
jgi:hypothetical protein